MAPSIALLRHDNVKFQDQTVYFTGNAYFGCEFHKCVIIVKGLPYFYQNCKFNGCIWHLDLILHDREQAIGLQKFIAENIALSLPSVATDKVDSPPPPSFQGPIDVTPR